MGADQSSTAGAVGVPLRSQRDEDIPYTSYSISKPIDGDTPRASPMRVAKSRSPNLREAAQQYLAPSAGPPKHDIVVVAEGCEQQVRDDPELKKLESIPMFLPLMRGSLNLPASSGMATDGDGLDKVDSRQVLQLCVRYQDHLRQCGEAVAFDQNALCVRIKEVDFVIQSLYNNLTERQKKFAKYAEQIQKVNEMSNVLNKVKMNVEQIVPLMERLNAVLPPEERLEPFSIKSSSTSSK